MMASELTKKEPSQHSLLADILILHEIMLLYKGQPTIVRYIISTGNTFLSYQLLSCNSGFLITSVLLPHSYMRCLANPRVIARKN